MKQVKWLVMGSVAALWLLLVASTASVRAADLGKEADLGTEADVGVGADVGGAVDAENGDAPDAEANAEGATGATTGSAGDVEANGDSVPDEDSD